MFSKVILKLRKLQFMKISKVTLNPERVSKAWVIAHALAHPLRLKIIDFVHRQGTTNVNNIYNALKIEQSITSQHLKILREANIVVFERDGKFVHYSINYNQVEQASNAVRKFTYTDEIYHLSRTSMP